MKFCISGKPGAMAHAHLKAIREIEGSSVTVIQSRTQDGADKAAAEFGVPTALTDFERAVNEATSTPSSSPGRRRSMRIRPRSPCGRASMC